MRSKRFLSLLGAIYLALLVSACATRNELAAPAQNFYTATSTLAIKEQQLLTDVNAARSEGRLALQVNQFLSGSGNYSVNRPDPLVPQDQITPRIAAVQALQLYAQRLVAIAGGDTSAEIDNYSLSFAKALSAQIPAIQNDKNFGAGIAAGMDALLKIITDRVAYTSIVDIAKKTDEDVQTLAIAIKSDDAAFANNLRSAQLLDERSREQYLNRIRADGKLSVKDKFDEYRRIVSGTTQAADAADEADSLSRLADSVAAAHSVLAKGQEQTFLQLAQEAFNRAKDAYDIFNKAKK